MTAAEARYYRVSRGCHAAWLNTQPQFVIPGVLDEADAGTNVGCAGNLLALASVSSSAALRGSPQEPRLPWSGAALDTPKEEL